MWVLYLCVDILNTSMQEWMYTSIHLYIFVWGIVRLAYGHVCLTPHKALVGCLHPVEQFASGHKPAWLRRRKKVCIFVFLQLFVFVRLKAVCSAVCDVPKQTFTQILRCVSVVTFEPSYFPATRGHVMMPIHGSQCRDACTAEWVISKFNGTPTPKGSYSAKTGVNCTMSLSRVY